MICLALPFAKGNVLLHQPRHSRQHEAQAKKVSHIQYCDCERGSRTETILYSIVCTDVAVLYYIMLGLGGHPVRHYIKWKETYHSTFLSRNKKGIYYLLLLSLSLSPFFPLFIIQLHHGGRQQPATETEQDGSVLGSLRSGQAAERRGEGGGSQGHHEE